MTSTSDLLELFTTRADRFQQVTSAVASADWSNPSPCDGWTAADVAHHIIETQRSFLSDRGHDLPEPDSSDAGAAISQHLDAVRDLLAQQGVADTAYGGWFGPTTIATTMADFYGWDMAIHGWDIARATGQDYVLDDDEVAALGATADGWGPMLHSEGICAAPLTVDESASAQDRLLARLGRTPR